MPLSEALATAQAQQEKHLAQLKAFLSIPSISTLPEAMPDIRRAAVWTASYLKEIGLQRVQLIDTPRNPVVYGEWLGAPGRPTVLCYGHYDVQPVDPLELWRTPPFEPTVVAGSLFARGAADDKGQLFTHLAAVDAMLKAGGGLPVNVKFLIEGEEEIGSPSLERVVIENRDMLAADVCLISDSHIPGPDQPAIITSIRGLSAIQVVVTGPERDLHSGVYGGAVHNPLQALCEIIAQLHDTDGRITVPHFYDRVRPLRDADRAAIAEIPFDRGAWLAEAGNLAQDWGEPDYTIPERTTSRPTLEINGLGGGFVGDGIKTVLPSRAIAKISCRLVADQDAKEIQTLVGDYICTLAPPGVRVEITPIQSGPAAMVDLNHPAVQVAADAYEAVFGNKPLYLREGGSIPVVAMLQQHMHMASIMMGFGLPDDALHSPNEKMSLAQIHKGTATVIHFLYGMAQTSLH